MLSDNFFLNPIFRCLLTNFKGQKHNIRNYKNLENVLYFETIILYKNG